MSLVLHLCRKEARDARGQFVGALLGVAALVAGHYALVAYRAAGGPVVGSDDILRLWVGVAATLGGGAVAADAFAGEATSRRIDGTAVLPTGLGRVFAAKALVSGVATLLLGGWAALCAVLAATVFTHPTSALHASAALPDAFAFALLALFPVAATALFAVVLEHGLGAVVCGILVTTCAVVFGRLSVPWDEWGIDEPTPGALVWMALPAVAVLGAATRLAFVRGPIHLDRKLRRAVLGLGLAAAVLVPTGAATAAVLDRRADLEPGDSAAVIVHATASPDGRHALLLVGNRRAPKLCAAWIADVETGAIRVLPGRHRSFGAWTDDGGVNVWRTTWLRAQTPDDLLDTFDLATGKLVRVRSREQERTAARDEGWARLTLTNAGVHVEWPDRGVRELVPGAFEVSVSPRPGRFAARWGESMVLELGTELRRPVQGLLPGAFTCWSEDGGRLVYARPMANAYHELDVETGALRAIPCPGTAWGTASGRYAWFSAPGGFGIYDLLADRVTVPPWKSGCIDLVRGAESYAVAFGLGETTRVIDCATGRTAVIAEASDAAELRIPAIASIGGGRFVFVRGDRQVEVLGADGRTERVLLAAGE